MSTRIILSLCLVLLMSPESLHASAKKPQFIIGVDVNRLLHEVFGKETSISRRGTGRRGVSYSLMKNNKSIGGIEIGVFSDQTSATNIFEEHLLYTSMGPNRNLSKELGDKAFGWWGERERGFRRILLVRDNVVISVYMPEMSSDIVMALAKAIDSALIEGTYGVCRRAIVRLPRIMKVQAQEEILAGTTVEVKVHVAVPEAVIGDSLGFVDRMGVEIRSGVPIINRHREVEIIRTLEYHVPRVLPEPEKVSFEACYATPGCLIASKKFTLADLMEQSADKPRLPSSQDQ